MNIMYFHYTMHAGLMAIYIMDMCLVNQQKK